MNKKDEPELRWLGILSILDYLLFLCLLIVLICYFQPAARKGADKSGPGAGFTVLSEKTLFLGQKVSQIVTLFYHSIDQKETKLALNFKHGAILFCLHKYVFDCKNMAIN